MPTDRRGPIRIGPTRLLMTVCLAVICLGASRVEALDVFTLWRQPELAIDIFDGAWVEYRSQTISGGKRDVEYTRLQCVGETGNHWSIEAIPMREVDNKLEPVPGEGWRFDLSKQVTGRNGDLLDHINTVVHWEGGHATSLSADQWRDDPLLSSTFAPALPATGLEIHDDTIRVVSGVELKCRQYVAALRDTNTVALPRGEMQQILYKEVGIAVHENVPFFNIAYVAERTNTETIVVPQGRGRRAPPPTSRVQIMELVGFGRRAKALLR